MFAKTANATPAVPSRNALRTLRQLALAGGTLGGFCAVAAITYDAHRRVRVAEKIIENKRTLHSSAPYYDAKASARRLAAMMEAAEAGQFMGLDSLKNGEQQKIYAETDVPEVSEPAHSSPVQPDFATRKLNLRIPPISPFKYRSSNVDERGTIQDQAALAWEAENEPAREEGELSTDERIREMVLQNKEIEASNLFLNLTPPRAGEFISAQRRELGCQLFVANCTKGNIYIARSLFERLEKWTYVDSELWGMMMHLLAKEGHVESVGRVYDKYWDRLDVPVHLLEIVLRCLLESRRLRSAKWLFYDRLKHDEGCGMCGAYLDGLWRKTHKSELMDREFRTILKSLIDMGRKPTEKVFNPLLKSFIEAGKFEDAETLVKDMPEKWGVQPGCRTLGLLAYGRAVMGDWDGVMTELREMHSLGLTQEKRNFAHVFDRVFLEYYPSHTGREIYDFLVGCINEFGIKPDNTLHRHILEALIDRGDAEMVKQISHMSETQRWDSGIDENDIVRILKARRVSMEQTPIGLWRMIQAARVHHGLVASSRRLMGTSAASYSLDRDVLAPIHLNAKENYSVSANMLLAKRSVDVYIPLHKRMEQAIHAGRFVDALKAFRHANSNGHPIKSLHVQLAVIATILDGGRDALGEAKELIKGEWAYWHKMPSVRYTAPEPRFTPIFFQQLVQLKRARVRDITVYKLALFEFYNLCAEKPTLIAKHHVSAALAHRLIRRDQGGTAIAVLRAVYLSKWRKILGFDQVQLKLLLRAYAQARYARGVWWCLLTVLSRHEPISPDFRAEVRRAMPGLKKALHEMNGDVRYPHADNLRALKQASHAVEMKCKGDPYWSRFEVDLQLKSKMRAQRVIQDCTSQHVLRPGETLEKVITEFDEEIAFDLLLNGQYFTEDPKELERTWDEMTLSFQTRIQPENTGYPLSPREQKRRRA